MKAKLETQAAVRRLRLFVVTSGLAVAVIFLVLGTATRLEMYGDGSIFSYSVAAQEAWTFHWHNISDRLFTYIFAYVLPEQIVALTSSARAGITAYGLLFFSAPLLGLLLTFAADRSRGRVVFTYACASTAILCPLVFGAPTEMWMAHALFWPALALCIRAPSSPRSAILVCLALLALVFTHEGAVVLAISILLALFIRGGRDAIFLRAGTAFFLAMLVWALVKLTIRPDPYIAEVIAAAAFRFIDIDNLAQPAFLTLIAALAAYSAVSVLLRRLGVAHAYVYAALICALLLAVFWLRFDRWLLAEARYDLRTVLLIVIPPLGVLATLQTMPSDQWARAPLPFIGRWFDRIQCFASPAALAGALALVLLVHAVETAKFIYEWIEYKSAVRTLATGSASDPELGSPLFVSSQRIPADLNRLAWNSTTPFLSVLVAPEFKPARLVVDPTAGYFWLSCQTAKRSEAESRALPEEARRLIRVHACLHRPD
jgi:hypothetical protein